MLPQPRRCSKHLADSPRCLARSCGKSREYPLNVPQRKGCGTTRAAQRQLNEGGHSCAKRRPRSACLARLAGRCGPRAPHNSAGSAGSAGRAGRAARCPHGAGAAPRSQAPAVERPPAAGRLPGLLRDPPALRPAAGTGSEHGGRGQAPQARRPPASPPQRPPGRHLAGPAVSAPRLRGAPGPSGDSGRGRRRSPGRLGPGPAAPEERGRAPAAGPPLEPVAARCGAEVRPHGLRGHEKLPFARAPARRLPDRTGCLCLTTFCWYFDP